MAASSSFNFKTTLLMSVMTPALAIAALSTTPAFAQSQPAASTDEGLEVVVVTARKREESSQDVPASITAIRGDALTTVTSGGADIGSALSARVPSVVVESSFGRTFPRFYIRGLGNTDFDLNASQPVSLIYDEVVQENPILKGFPAFDLQRIEVLRGPQGTLFGRNTPAGIVKFDSVRPGAGAGSYARIGLRSYEGIDAEAALDLPADETFAVRLSGIYQTQNDWVTNTVTSPAGSEFGGYSDAAWRAQVLWKPYENFSALLNVHGRTFDGTSQLFRANVMTTGRRGLNSNFVADRVTYDGGGGNNQRLESGGAILRLDFDFETMTLTTVSSTESLEFLGRGDIDGGFGADFLGNDMPGFIPFDADTADGIDDHSQVTHEVRLSSNSTGPMSWQAGAYYFSEEVSIYSINYASLFPGQPVNGRVQQNQETTSWALFGSLTYDVSDALSVTGGLRYTNDDKTLTASRSLSPLSFLGVGPLPPVTRAVEDDAFSWDLSAVYALNDTTNLYARAARGYRAPSIQGRVLFGDAVSVANSETLTSVEAGFKMVSADVSAFVYQIDDIQLTAVGGATNFNQLINAEAAMGQGVEAEVQWLPTNWLSLSGSLAYNGTEIDDPGLRVAVCGAPCTVLDPTVVVGGTTLARIDGNGLPNAPEWTANFSAKYSRDIGPGEFYIITDWAYKGETNFFLYESVEFSEDGFWEGGLRVGYNIADLEFAVYGRNILNEERLTGGIDFNNLTGFTNTPRVVGAEVKVRF
jgi:iron complex outermembrane recepter protein